MRTVLVTVESSDGAADLELPLEVQVGVLLPLLLTACSSPLAGASGMAGVALALGTSEGGSFSAGRTLADCGVVDGMRLLLQQEDAWRRRMSTPGASLLPADVPSSVQTGGIGIRWSRDI